MAPRLRISSYLSYHYLGKIYGEINSGFSIAEAYAFLLIGLALFEGGQS